MCSKDLRDAKWGFFIDCSGPILSYSFFCVKGVQFLFAGHTPGWVTNIHGKKISFFVNRFGWFFMRTAERESLFRMACLSQSTIPFPFVLLEFAPAASPSASYSTPKGLRNSGREMPLVNGSAMFLVVATQVVLGFFRPKVSRRSVFAINEELRQQCSLFRLLLHLTLKHSARRWSSRNRRSAPCHHHHSGCTATCASPNHLFCWRR